MQHKASACRGSACCAGALIQTASDRRSVLPPLLLWVQEQLAESLGQHRAREYNVEEEGK